MKKFLLPIFQVFFVAEKIWHILLFLSCLAYSETQFGGFCLCGLGNTATMTVACISLLSYISCIGEGASKILVRRIFVQISPNLPELIVQLLPTNFLPQRS